MTPSPEKQSLIELHSKVVRALGILEKFNGSHFVTVKSDGVVQESSGQFFAAKDSSSSGGGVTAVEGVKLAFVNISEEQIDLLFQSYEALKESIYGNLVVQTRLEPYLEEITISINASNDVVVDYSSMFALLEANRVLNPEGALADLVELNRYRGSSLYSTDWNGLETLRQWTSEIQEGSAESQILNDLHVISSNQDNTATDAAEIYFDGDNSSRITTLGGNDIVAAGTGDDQVFAGDGDDYVRGDEGDDSIFGGRDDDELIGNEGNDYLHGELGDDTLIGGAGDDRLYGNHDDDTLEGNDGADRLYGGIGNDVLNGGQGDDYLNGELGDDIYLVGVGHGKTTIANYDYIVGRKDILRFLDGIAPTDIKVERVNNNLILTNISTADVVEVSSYFTSADYELNAIEFSDGTIWSPDYVKGLVLIPTDGDDIIKGYAADETLSGGAGNDQIYGGSGNDSISGNVGDDHVYGEEGDDTIHGNEGSDRLYGNAGNDTLYGGEGQDSLFGGDGDDVLRAGPGLDDYMSGAQGNDTYLFGLGDGSVSISNHDTDEGRHDVLRFLEGISPDDVAISRDGSHLVLSLEATGDVVTVWSFFSVEGNVLNAIEFSDGTSWSPQYLFSLMLTPTQGDDTLHGYDSDDIISGEGGNDHLHGGEGNDTLQGDAGDDRLYGQAGNDHLQGGDGSDALFGGEGDDILQGGAGDDDYLNGGQGNDKYLFTAGEGNLEISNGSSAVNDNDVLELLGGITQDGVTLNRSSDHLIINVLATNEAITIRSYFDQDGNSGYSLDQIVFSDGSSLTYDDIKLMTAGGTELNDNLYGTDEDDFFLGLGGDDRIYGRAGNDNLSGDMGNDYVYGDDGDDVVSGNAGDDYLYGNNGNDTLDGGDGTDRLYGGFGDDTLRGGAGANDYLIGEYGNDTYLFAVGDGNTNISNYDGSAGRHDVLRFMSGIAPSDILVSRTNSNLTLTLASSGEVITVTSFFSSSIYELNAIEFEDGSYWTSEDLKVMVLAPTDGNDTIKGYDGDEALSGAAGNDNVYGGAGNDSVSGDDGNDYVYGDDGDDAVLGGAGNDYVYGGNGNDTLEGGDGADRLYGGFGNDVIKGGSGSNDYLSGDQGDDTYIFAAGDGSDTISNYDTSGGNDIAEFSALTHEELWFTRSGNHLVVNVVGTDDQLTVNNWYASPSYQLDGFKAQDGDLSYDQVDQLVNAMATFDVPSGVGAVVPQEVKDSLQPVLTSSWQFT